MMSWHLRFGLLVAILSHAGAARAQDSDWTIFPGDGFVPDNTRHVHDPTIMQINKKFYCFSTSGGGFGVLKSSDDLVHWTDHGAILRGRPQWLQEKIPDARSIWAPDIVRTQSGLRMYYCASERFGVNTSYIGMATLDSLDPVGNKRGWQDQGMILQSIEKKDPFNAIDPDVITDETGRQWMFFGSYYAGLFVVELDPKTGLLLGPNKPNMIPVARTAPRTGNTLEAPVVFRRGEYYYLFNSYGLAAQGVRSSYYIGVGRSKSVAGPYVAMDGTPMLDGGHTVVLRSSPPMFGPGHCDVMQDESGRTLLAHHYYDGRKKWTPDTWGLPTLHVRELIWTDDGWPLPGLPIGFTPTTKPSPGVAGTWIHQADFGETATIQLTPDGAIVDGNRSGTWKLEGNVLTLTWPRGERTFVDKLIVKDNYYVGRNGAGLLIRGVKKQ